MAKPKTIADVVRWTGVSCKVGDETRHLRRDGEFKQWKVIYDLKDEMLSKLCGTNERDAVKTLLGKRK